MKNGTAKVVCKCEHVAQDQLHGKQTRIANATAKEDDKTVEVRCTVCKVLHRVNKGQVK